MFDTHPLLMFARRHSHVLLYAAWFSLIATAYALFGNEGLVLGPVAPVLDLKKAQDLLREKREEASAKWKKFDDARNSATKEAQDDDGLKKMLTDPNSDVFQKIDEIHKEYSTVADEVKQIEGRIDTMIDWESSGEPSDPTKTPSAGLQSKGPVGIYQPGQRLVESKEYLELKNSGLLDIEESQFRMPAAKVMERGELKMMLRRGRAGVRNTLVTQGSGTSAGAFDEPDRQPFVDLPRRGADITPLITVGETDEELVEWVRQTSRTNNAAETAEATATSGTSGTLPESAVAWVIEQSSVRDIGHWIPATRKALRNEGTLRTMLEQELEDGVIERTNNQVLSGDGVAPNLRGIYNTAGIQTYARGIDESRSDAIHKIITLIRLAFYEPGDVTLDPRDWEEVRLEKDANGNYIYGPPSSRDPMSIWGLDAKATQYATQNIPLIGDFKRSTLWVREGVLVAASDSHQDFFVRGMIALKATFSAAFAVPRPLAFGTVTNF